MIWCPTQTITQTQVDKFTFCLKNKKKCCLLTQFIMQNWISYNRFDLKFQIKSQKISMWPKQKSESSTDLLQVFTHNQHMLLYEKQVLVFIHPPFKNAIPCWNLQLLFAQTGIQTIRPWSSISHWSPQRWPGSPIVLILCQPGILRKTTRFWTTAWSEWT